MTLGTLRAVLEAGRRTAADAAAGAIAAAIARDADPAEEAAAAAEAVAGTALDLIRRISALVPVGERQLTIAEIASSITEHSPDRVAVRLRGLDVEVTA